MPRYAGNVDAVRSLVRETEVHRDIYVDEEVFQLEMEHLFANTWVYVGHESEVPNANDYVVKSIGPQSVIIDEVHNGVPMRMAILARAMGKAK